MNSTYWMYAWDGCGFQKGHSVQNKEEENYAILQIMAWKGCLLH